MVKGKKFGAIDTMGSSRYFKAKLVFLNHWAHRELGPGAVMSVELEPWMTGRARLPNQGGAAAVSIMLE